MKEINNIEVFRELIKELQEQDLELVESTTMDPLATDKLDCVNQLVFRSYNTQIIKRDVLDIVSKYNDSEFASFSVHQIEDIYIVFASV